MQALMDHPDIEGIRARARAEGIRIPPKFLYGLETAEEKNQQRVADDLAEDTLP